MNRWITSIVGVGTATLAVSLWTECGTQAEAGPVAPGHGHGESAHAHPPSGDAYEVFLAALLEGKPSDKARTAREAVAALSKLADSYEDPEMGPLLQAYAHALYSEGRYVEAADLFEQLAVGGGDAVVVADAMRSRAQIHLFEMNRAADAATWYERYIEYVQSSDDERLAAARRIHLGGGYSKLSMALRRLNRLEEAVAARQALLDMGPHPADWELGPWARIENARDLRSMGRVEASVSAWDAAIESVETLAAAGHDVSRWNVEALRWARMETIAPDPSHPGRATELKAFIAESPDSASPGVIQARVELARGAVFRGEVADGLAALEQLVTDIETIHALTPDARARDRLDEAYLACVLTLVSHDFVSYRHARAYARLSRLSVRLSPDHDMAATVRRTEEWLEAHVKRGLTR